MCEGQYDGCSIVGGRDEAKVVGVIVGSTAGDFRHPWLPCQMQNTRRCSMGARAGERVGVPPAKERAENVTL